MTTLVCCESLPCTTSSGTDAVEVGRTGMMLYVPVTVAVHGVPTAMPLHGWAGSWMETVMGPALARSDSKSRRRAPVELRFVVVEVVEVGKGNRILTCPEVESFGTVPPPESVRIIRVDEEILGALR